jgi:predicted dienelactone hydrolase
MTMLPPSPRTRRDIVLGAQVLVLLLGVASCRAKSPAHPGECGVSATADADISEPGPFHVGFRKSQISYTPPGETSPRTIGMDIWYPTNDTSGPPAVYDPLNIFVDPQSFDGASLAPPLSSCGYPTIEHSHGYQGLGGGASFLMRHFASHGWVALAADHTENTLWGNVTPLPIPFYFERATDMSALLDEAEQFQAPDPLANKIATDKVLLTGHSFGTFTVWSAAGAQFDVSYISSQCSAATPCTPAELDTFAHGVRDPRVVAGLPMAGSPWQDPHFTADDLTAVHIPIFQMSGTDNLVGDDQLWAQLTNPDYHYTAPLTWIDIAGGCHESFDLVQYIGGCPTLATDVGYKIIRTYALAFARHHVLGDRSALVTNILDGTTQISSLVTFQTTQ